nr:hypothetical protein [Tanacetum cinerariifolium]
MFYHVSASPLSDFEKTCNRSSFFSILGILIHSVISSTIAMWSVTSPPFMPLKALFCNIFKILSPIFSSKSMIIVRRIESKEYAVLVRQYAEGQIHCLGCRIQYVVLGRRFDTSYPTGGYGVSEIYMHQIWFTINKKDSTSFKFKIDKKRFSLSMEVFREIFQICPNLPYQEFDALPSDEEIVSSSKNLDIEETYGNLMPTRLIYATGAASPKMKRKLKKPASPSKKRTLVIKKAPSKVARSKGIELLSDAALLEEAQLKNALKRRKRETTIHQAGGSSKGVDFELKVLDEPKGDDERTDEPTETDNPKSSNDEEEIQDDEFVHTPEDYVSTDDESNDVTEEKYERINEELYGDVNVSLTYFEPADKENDDVEMTVVGYVNVN